MEGLEFLQFVFGKQPGDGAVSIAYKEHETHWDEQCFDDGGFTLNHGEYATYFCPNTFEHRRKKEQCLPGVWLWQDLDEVTPQDCDILGYPPTLYWETSPNRYQALWLLDSSLPPEELAQLNKALNRRLGADKGTWNLTRLLRVPGSYNGKRGCQVGEAHDYSLIAA